MVAIPPANDVSNDDNWELLQVNAGPKPQRVIAAGGYFENPQGLLVVNGAIYVTDVATPDRNFGLGRVIRVAASTGDQRVVSQANYLVAPVGIAVDENGQLVVADPYTINPQSPDWYDGGIIRINPSTGKQTLIARGHGGVVNPCGLAIVPTQIRGLRGFKPFLSSTESNLFSAVDLRARRRL